jgi:YbbR domain-containing protein
VPAIITAYLDMTDATIGQEPAEKIEVSLPDDVQLVSIDPLSINLTVEKAVSRQYPVR